MKAGTDNYLIDALDVKYLDLSTTKQHAETNKGYQYRKFLRFIARLQYQPLASPFLMLQHSAICKAIISTTIYYTVYPFKSINVDRCNKIGIPQIILINKLVSH